MDGSCRSIRELRDHEEIHLKRGDYLECVACGKRPVFMVHYDYGDMDKWSMHTRRCNVIFNPD
jgi:hypothetical protein